MVELSTIDLRIIAIICVIIFGLFVTTFFLLSPKQIIKRNQNNKQKSKKKSSSPEVHANPAPGKSKIATAPIQSKPVAAVVKAEIKSEDLIEALPQSKPGKSKETPEQRAARLERQKLAKSKKSVVTETKKLPPSNDAVVALSPAVPTSRPVISDGWAVVEKVKVRKPKEVVKADVPSESLGDSLKKQITVDSKKIGLIIGPKGSVMRSIQELTGVEIVLPAVAARPTSGPTIVTLSGTADSVSRASAIVSDLCSKGYSAHLAGEDFQESSVSIHPMYLPEIIGKNGASIRAIQDQLGVRLNVPQGVGREHTSKVKIAVAGPKDQVAAAKAIIHEIESVYHSEMTHPGFVHAEIDVPERMYNFIIGPKGSEIRHIENNFKVSVFIPNADSLNKAVVVVGSRVGVEGSERYIRKIIAQVGSDEVAAADVMQSWSEHADPNDVTVTTDEPWMGEYMYDRNAKNAASKTGDDKGVSPSTVSSAIPAAASAASAWGNVSASEGW